MLAESGFRVLTAPRVAPLRDHLVARLRAEPLPPREKEIVVVQSQGMRQWIKLQLADGLGCAGSLELPFPAAFIHGISRRLKGEPPRREDTDRFSREVLTWRVDALLRALPASDPVYEPLRGYLRDGDDRMRFGLAERIASRFDEYLLYRPDTLLEWEAGANVPHTPHALWQAALWRLLCAQEPGEADHAARRLRDTVVLLRDGAPPGLPRRVTVFGVSTLAPLFIEVLAGLARHIRVTVYAAVLDRPVVHPLARAFGAQSAEFLDLLTQSGGVVTRLEPAAEARPGLLQTLQQELTAQDAGDAPLPIMTSDPTLRIHSAHGPMRQLEVLRDQLLAALAADPTLRPHDLLLLVPDVSEWAPLVDAVFGVPTDDVPSIPYRVADRPLRRTQPAADAFARLLALHGGRFARSEVFGLLAVPLMRQAADLSDSEVEELQQRTGRSNIRWGYDGVARGALGLPVYEEASWRLGLDRLLLGFAVGRETDEVLGVLPVAGDTAGETESLGKLADWVDRLASTLAGWNGGRPPAAWADVLLDAVRTFLGPKTDVERRNVSDLEAVILRLGTLGGLASYGADVALGVVRDWLESELEHDSFGSGFHSGGMTVAALKPMRSIPYRVIGVAGLEDSAFPRRERRAAFDLLEEEHLLGDRDLRGDDRQLFLDLLLAAGDRLVLAFTGRTIRDNSVCAPSVVIDELLDHLDRRSEGEARRRLVVEHPLQPFSLRYFTADRDERLFSYSQAAAGAAQASVIRQERDLVFVAPGTVAKPAVSREFVLKDLTECWVNPSKFYCTRTLDLWLEDAREGVEDEELFSPSYLEQGLVRSKLLSAALEGSGAAERARGQLLACGLLPPGKLGEAWHARLSAEVDEV